MDITQQLRRLYLTLVLFFGSLTLILVAWHWQQPKTYALGFSYQQSFPILLIASFLINSISYYYQDRYVRRLLQRENIRQDFNLITFTLRFYLYNLGIAIILSLIFFLPLFYMLFFYWIYPMVCWFIPYHLIMGVLLGGKIQQSLR